MNCWIRCCQMLPPMLSTFTGEIWKCLSGDKREDLEISWDVDDAGI